MTCMLANDSVKRMCLENEALLPAMLGYVVTFVTLTGDMTTKVKMPAVKHQHR